MVVGLRFAILIGMSASAAVISAPVPVTLEFNNPARGSAALAADSGDTALPVGGDARGSVCTTTSSEARQHWARDRFTFVTPDAITHDTDDPSCVEEGSANVTRDTSLFDAVALSSPTAVAYEVDLVVLACLP
jgi:hypothetical protein